MKRTPAPRLIVWGLALLPGLPIVAGFLITSHSAARGAPAAGYNPVEQTSHLTPRPPTEQGATVAVVEQPTIMRRAPGGRRIAALQKRTEFGSPEALWVVSRSGGWLGVVSSLAGNGKLGWIPQSAASLTHVEWEMKVSLAQRKLTVLDNGKVTARYTVAVGRPSAPTPTGRFAVTDRLTTGDPTGPYGCCILALSARSPHAIQGWNGGDRIAIHSTPDTSSIGHPVSHGCVRLTLAQGRWLLNHIPLGTPTLISG
ncbi:MAG: L,D-transpeptidase [Solirubrobacterales bacterium]|nr:L,D-transpeptidase [Solirubrobacterales bacterium]